MISRSVTVADGQSASSWGVRVLGWAAANRMLLLGCLFVAAGNAVVYGDAGYALLSPVFAIIVAGSLAIPLAAALAFSRWRRTQAIVFALGVTYFLDVAYLGGGDIGAAAVLAVPVFVWYLLERRGYQAIVPFAATGVAVATALILVTQSFSHSRLSPAPLQLASGGQAHLRPYVHIVLDEMASLDRMPSGPYFDALKQRMIDDYQERGFDLFTDTESSTGATEISFERIFGTAPEGAAEPAGGSFAFELDRNRLAETLIEDGYAVSMLQSSYIDVCRPEGSSCATYSRSGDGAAIEEYADSFGDRLEYALLDLHLSLVFTEMTRASTFYKGLTGVVRNLGVELPQSRLFVARPPSVLRLMKGLKQTAAGLERGKALFAHLLLPHFPYVLAEDCKLKHPGERTAPRWLTRQGDPAFSADEAARGYWEQAACTHAALMAIIDSAIAAPGGEDAVIVIHGDHGSRLFEKGEDPTSIHSDEERRHAVSTHFAVRGLPERKAEIAAHTGLRDRISIVLDAISGRAPSGVVSAAAAAH